MKITVNARKVFVNQKLTEHIEKKLAKFDKFFPLEAEATVKLSRVRDMERVEVTIQSGNTLFRSEDENSTFMNALDCCLYAIERQIRKNKTRLSRRLKEGAFQRTVQEEVSFAPDAEEEISIAKIKQFYFKPMTREEAVMQMNLLDHNFFAFRDEDNGGAFAVVYKRNDGGYGLINDTE